MGQCLGVDKLRLDLDRQKRDLKSTWGTVSELRKEIDSLRQEIAESNQDILDKLNDWTSNSQNNEKTRVQKETAHQIEISVAAGDVATLKGDLRKLTLDFLQYKKENTAILIALHQAHEARERNGEVTHHTHEARERKVEVAHTKGEEAASRKRKTQLFNAARAIINQNSVVANISTTPNAMAGKETHDEKATAGHAEVPSLNLAGITNATGKVVSNPAQTTAIPKMREHTIVVDIDEPLLGITLIHLSSEEKEWFRQTDATHVARLKVKEFREGSPTDRAGLQQNDILESIDSHKFTDSKTMLKRLGEVVTNKQVILGVLRLD